MAMSRDRSSGPSGADKWWWIRWLVVATAVVMWGDRGGGGGGRSPVQEVLTASRPRRQDMTTRIWPREGLRH